MDWRDKVSYLMALVGLVGALVCFFAKDFLWDVMKARNESMGLQSTRPSSWNDTTNIAGMLFVAAVVLILFLEIRP